MTGKSSDEMDYFGWLKTRRVRALMIALSIILFAPLLLVALSNAAWVASAFFGGLLVLMFLDLIKLIRDGK